MALFTKMASGKFFWTAKFRAVKNCKAGVTMEVYTAKGNHLYSIAPNHVVL